MPNSRTRSTVPACAGMPPRQWTRVMLLAIGCNDSAQSKLNPHPDDHHVADRRGHRRFGNEDDALAGERVCCRQGAFEKLRSAGDGRNRGFRSRSFLRSWCRTPSSVWVQGHGLFAQHVGQSGESRPGQPVLPRVTSACGGNPATSKDQFLRMHREIWPPISRQRVARWCWPGIRHGTPRTGPRSGADMSVSALCFRRSHLGLAMDGRVRFGNRFTGHDLGNRLAQRVSVERFSVFRRAMSERATVGKRPVLSYRKKSGVQAAPKARASPGCRRSDREGPPRTGNLFTRIPGWPILRVPRQCRWS